MSEKPTNKAAPVHEADLTEEWIAERKAIIERDGHAVRAGAHAPVIEIQSINHPDFWQPLNLPGNTPFFHSECDRDMAINRLYGIRCGLHGYPHRVGICKLCGDKDPNAKPLFCGPPSEQAADALAAALGFCPHGVALDIPCVECIQEAEKTK